MSYDWIDDRDVSPADRETLAQIGRRAVARMERESAAFEEQQQIYAEREADEFTAGLEAEQRAASEAAAKMAAAAGSRSRGAFKKVRKFLTEAAETRGEQASNLEGLALDAARRAAEWEDIERRASARILREPDVYHRGSMHSWFADVALRATRRGDADTVAAANERLTRYGRQLADRKFEADGIRAQRLWREAARPKADDGVRASELRAMTTNPASGGSFVVPVYVVEDAAQYRTGSPAFWKVGCTQRPLPDHGMSVFVPKWTLGPNVAAGTENVAPTEVDPTSAYVEQPITMYAGTINASQAFADRVGPVSDDAVLYAQIIEELEAAIDAAAISAAFAGASTITRTTTSGLTAAMFASDLGQAGSGLETTAGTKMPARTLIAHPTIGEWLLAQNTGGQWFQLGLGGVRTDDGRTGQNAHGLDFALDPNLPATSGGFAQLAVGNPLATFVYGGTDPIFDAMPVGGGAGSLTVVYRLRCYASVINRYPAGTAIVTGNGYPSSPTWG